MGGPLSTVAKVLYGVLAALTVATVIVSIQPSIAVRQIRNLTILASFVVGVVLLFADRWLRPAAVWAAVGLVSGLLYFGYETWSIARAREKNPEEDHGQARASTIILGLFAWPLSLPEVIEYGLADLGFIKAGGTAPNGEEDTSNPEAGSSREKSGGDA